LFFGFIHSAMGSQWENFLQNLGQWQGSFASIDADGAIIDITPSMLTLARGEEERLVHFRLRRYGDGFDRKPTREINQEYRDLGKQVIFFDSGSFCKGSMQVAPLTPFGAEFGFLDGDRRHRLVTLYDQGGDFESLVLIREFRVGSDARELQPLKEEQLLGRWLGTSVTVSADWLEPELAPCELEFTQPVGQSLVIRTLMGGAEQSRGTGRDRLMQLPDSGYILVPTHVSHREAFRVEAGWLPAPGRLQRLIRHYDSSGAWTSATWIWAKAA
jgi:hypothetical protein